MQYPVVDYRGTPKTLKNFVSYLFRAGLPVYLNDDLMLTSLVIKKNILHSVPSSSKNHHKIIKKVYQEVSQLCKETGSKLIICIMGTPEGLPDPEEVELLQNIPGALVVNSFDALNEHLPNEEEEVFWKKYAHYRGFPPVLIDGHPNRKAHQIIANEIILAIEKSKNN